VKNRLRKSVLILLLLWIGGTVLLTSCTFNSNSSGNEIEEQVPENLGPGENSPAKEGEGEKGLPTPSL